MDRKEGIKGMGYFWDIRMVYLLHGSTPKIIGWRTNESRTSQDKVLDISKFRMVENRSV